MVSPCKSHTAGACVGFCSSKTWCVACQCTSYLDNSSESLCQRVWQAEMCAQHQSLLSAGQALRLSGRNLTETDEVKLGAYHTLELEPQRAFTLAKACSGIPPVAQDQNGANTGSLGHQGARQAALPLRCDWLAHTAPGY